MSKKINVTIWNEYVHERHNDYVKQIYPKGIHGAIADFLADDDRFNVTLATLDMPDQGMPDEVLNNTDVLLWWGHMHHGEVDDKLVRRIRDRVYSYGMGYIPLHSAHHSKPFRAIIGATGDLVWGDDQPEIVWNLLPSHPIAAGIPEYFKLEIEELYSEPFYIPPPDELIFTSWFKNGNIFRSGCCFRRGLGKIFYFQPGHESCKSFYNPYVQRIIKNAIQWAAPNEFGVQYPATVRHEPNPVFKHE